MKCPNNDKRVLNGKTRDADYEMTQLVKESVIASGKRCFGKKLINSIKETLVLRRSD